MAIKERELSLEHQKVDAIKIAYELGYNRECLYNIAKAQNKNRITQILLNERIRLENGKKK